MKTFKEKIEMMNGMMERKSREDGTEYYCLNDKRPDWMRDVIYAVHGDKLPDDSTYQTISHVLYVLTDAEAENEREAIDTVQEIEPDCYTGNLTAWLAARADHVEYLTEAMEEGIAGKDGFSLLTAANYLYVQEIGNSLILEIESTEVE